MATKEKKLKLLTSQRDALYGRITKLFEMSTGISDEIILEEFLSLVETIDWTRDKFEEVNQQINTVNLEIDASYEPDFEKWLTFEDMFCKIKRKISLILERKPQLNKENNKCNRPKLPAIELPFFDGDIANWPIFYSSFVNTVHNNELLSNSEKLYYLLAKISKRVQTTFSGIVLSPENYVIIFNSLIDKYNDKRVISSAYIDQILDFKSFTVGNINNLESFVDHFVSAVSAVKNVNLENLCDFIFLHIALKKLDMESVKGFETNYRETDFPSFEDLVKFIREQIKVLQRTGTSRKSAANHSETSKRSQRSTQAFLSAGSDSDNHKNRPFNKCLLCNKPSHGHLYKCQEFKNLSIKERFNFVKGKGFCFRCLSEKHKARACNSDGNCHKCKDKFHHTMLHFEQQGASHRGQSDSRNAQGMENQTADQSIDPKEGCSNPDVALCTFSTVRSYNRKAHCTVLLATARVGIIDSQGNEHLIRCLLDSASQSNFITRDCCRRLGFFEYQRPSCSTVKGIGGSSKPIRGSIQTDIYSRFNRAINYNVTSLIVDKVTERLPTAKVDLPLLSYLKDLPLADESFGEPGEIDMLLGAQLFPHLLLSKRVQDPSHRHDLHALETVLGYVILGSAPTRVENNATVSCCAMMNEQEDICLKRFWELEEINVPSIKSPEDRECEEIYQKTTSRDPENGRYIVALPFKGDVSSLGDSFAMAKKRFLCLERKLEASPELREAYNDIITEYLEKDYLSHVTPNKEDKTPSYIIPHHGVIREDKITTSLRIVLDASAKTSTSVSLNNILYSGENLQGNLFDIIMNFRIFQIALSADIRKMFLCIGVKDSDRRYQRILYRFSPNEDIKTYQFNRVCFGLTSSPFQALRTIRQLGSDEGENFPEAKKIIEEFLYMDDFVYSVETEESAKETSSQLIALLKTGQFDLVKWTSNSQNVLESIPDSHRLSAIKEFDEVGMHKILGLYWSPNSDFFSFVTDTPKTICTKRNILSCVAKIWDIMGFIAPVVLYAKLLIKKLWIYKCDWDDEPPADIARTWMQFCEELSSLNGLKIPRHVGITSSTIVTIVGFADASEKAYGGVIYFHVQNHGANSVYVACAKTKVSPVKIVSLARLELCAALILAKLMRKVVENIEKRINIDNVFAFTDSTVALCWIQSSPHRWGTFVANRVSKIQSELSATRFFHIAGIDNPADCLSRGLTPSQILDHPLWFHGPPWMKLRPEEWPITAYDVTMVTQPPEQKSISLVVTSSLEEFHILTLSKRFSSWNKLLRCLIYVFRFLKVLPCREYISGSDLEFAELKVFRELQLAYFPRELINLQQGKTCKPVFQRLRPFLHDGLMRLGGRLVNSDLNYDQKHPIVLPRKDHILNLLVDHYHKIHCHSGPALLMSILRQKYWIISARSLIRNRVHKCNSCFRLHPKTIAPLMADHKDCRVTASVKPFTHVGIDFAGPLKVTISRRRGIRSQKAYICLFVCLTTRAIHLELASSLSTECFLNAFKRFLSRRGPVSNVYSDNGSNFVGAKRKLNELHAFSTSSHFGEEFASVLANNRISWHLNAPIAPHFGGNWESNIKSMKTHLFRVIGDQILSFEELTTVLAQVENILNTRPLCRTLSSDPSEPLALTPAHFLTTTPLKHLPAVEIDEDNLNLLSRHDLLDKLIQSFWKRWRLDYLHTLQVRPKWNTPANPVKEGLVVIVGTENSPPLHWPLGIIIEVFPAKDEVIRVARVKTASGSYIRPVVRLYPLPTQ